MASGCACAGPGGRQPATRCSGQARFEGYQMQESHSPTCYAGVPRLYLPASWLVDHVWSVICEVLHCAQDPALVKGNVHVSTPNGYMKLVCVCVCVCGVVLRISASLSYAPSGSPLSFSRHGPHAVADCHGSLATGTSSDSRALVTSRSGLELQPPALASQRVQAVLAQHTGRRPGVHPRSVQLVLATKTADGGNVSDLLLHTRLDQRAWVRRDRESALGTSLFARGVG